MADRLEQCIADISQRLLSLAGQEIRQGVRSALEQVGPLAGADRMHLMLPAAGREPTVISWIREGVPADWPTTDGQRIARFHWVGEHFRTGTPVHLPRLAELPADAVAEREEFERRAVRAALGFPVRSRGRVVGYLSLERVREEGGWSEAEIRSLRVFAEMLAGAVRRSEAEEALRESEERFRALAEHAPELVSEFGPDGRYLYASPSFKDLLGYDPQALIGSHPQDLIHPDDLGASRSSLVEAYESQGYARAVHRLRHSDGSWRWFDNTGRAFRTASGEPRFVSIGRDITERKAMQDALAQQLGFERRIAEMARRLLDLGSHEIDAWIQEGLASAAALARADYAYLMPLAENPPYETRRYDWLAPRLEREDVLLGDVAAGQFRWASQCIARGEIIQLAHLDALPPEAVAEREDLERRGVRSLLGIPVRSGRRTSGYLCFECLRDSRDWSEREVRQLRIVGDLFATAVRRKRDDEALRESQAQLLQAQKMEAVGQLAGGVAHDFNNLLMVILGNVQLLRERLGADSDAHEDAEEIRSAAERAASLTRQLLTFSRRPFLEPRGFDLNEVVGEAAEMLGRLLGEDVELVLSCDPRIPSVWGDPGLLEQVLVNLAVNARDAMGQGGRLELSTGAVRLSRDEAGRLGLPRGAYVVLGVRDSGAGMDEATRARAFEPFFTTKEPGKGTGLGLSIVYNIVQRSGGAVQLESEPGAGSLFRVFLPAAGSRAPAWASAPPRRRASHAGKTVLVVEDEDAVRRLVCNGLRRAGYRVAEAVDGMEALALAAEYQERAERIDLVLSDVVMPRLGGYELVRRLRDRQPDLRVVFMSGYPEPTGPAEAAHPGGGFLPKPFSEEALLARVREELDAGSEGAPPEPPAPPHPISRTS